MSDWLIEKLQEQIDSLRKENESLRKQLAVQGEPQVIYSPIETRPQLGGKHPNDNEAYDPDRKQWLDLRGDSDGQGLDCFWKWGHAAGWNDHKRHVSQPERVAWQRFQVAVQPLTKAEKVHRLVKSGDFPGMSEAFDAHVGSAAWTDPAWRDEASLWAAAWKQAVTHPQP